MRHFVALLLLAACGGSAGRYDGKVPTVTGDNACGIEKAYFFAATWRTGDASAACTNAADAAFYPKPLQDGQYPIMTVTIPPGSGDSWWSIPDVGTFYAPFDEKTCKTGMIPVSFPAGQSYAGDCQLDFRRTVEAGDIEVIGGFSCTFRPPDGDCKIAGTLLGTKNN